MNVKEEPNSMTNCKKSRKSRKFKERVCGYCSEIFNGVSALKQLMCHIRDRHQKILLRCPVEGCEKIFNKGRCDLVKSHCENFHKFVNQPIIRNCGLERVCGYCSEIFNGVSALKQLMCHIRDRHQKILLRCPVEGCEKIFNKGRSALVNSHCKNFHKFENPIMCQSRLIQCNNCTFFTDCFKKMHKHYQMCHDPSTCYQCANCFIYYPSRESLLYHLRTSHCTLQ